MPLLDACKPKVVTVILKGLCRTCAHSQLLRSVGYMSSLTASQPITDGEASGHRTRPCGYRRTRRCACGHASWWPDTSGARRHPIVTWVGNLGPLRVAYQPD